MHKKTFIFIALMFTLTWAVPSFAQPEPYWYNYGQARKVYEEKVAHTNNRNEKSMMDQNGNCQNGYRDNVKPEEAEACWALLKSMGNYVKKGWNFCVDVCTGKYKPKTQNQTKPKNKQTNKPQKKTGSKKRRKRHS